MKNHHRLVFFIGIMLNHFVTNAQEVYAWDSERSLAFMQGVTQTQKVGEVVGDYLLFESPKPSNLFLSNGKAITKIPVNYHVENNELLVEAGKVRLAFKTEQVDSLTISESGERFVNSSFTSSNEEDILYQIHFKSAAFELYEKKKVKVIPPSFNKELNTGSKETEIKKVPVFLLVDKAAGEVLEFKKAKKVIKSFENQGKIKAYIKEKELDLELISDFVELLSYYEKA